MRILCLAFSCGVLLAADTGGVAALPNGGSVSASAQASGVVLQVHDRPRLTPQMVLGVDNTVATGASPDIKVIGEATPGVVILEDSYYSKPGALSYCQAGKEQFLRVLDLAKPGRESLRVKVSSCIGDLELDDPGVVWSASAKSLEIHWLPNPKAASPHTYAKYEIGLRGRAQLVSPKQTQTSQPPSQ